MKKWYEINLKAEEEAKKKVCPLTINNDIEEKKFCIGSSCMGWITSSEEIKKVTEAQPTGYSCKIEKYGFCGLISRGGE